VILADRAFCAAPRRMLVPARLETIAAKSADHP
jgi:hypothetical protein